MKAESIQKKTPECSFPKAEQQLLLFCTAVVFLWGMAAHGQILTHGILSHDSLAEFDAAIFGNLWQVQLGRVLVPLYRGIFRTAATLPWLIGMLTLLWISLALYLLAHIFRLQQHRGILTLLGGILVTNITVTVTTSTYISVVDQNMFACLLAVLATFLWQRGRRADFWLGVLCIGVMLGLYQSYVSVMITLVLMVLILGVLRGEAFAATLKRGFSAVGMIVAGGMVYLVEIWLALTITGQQLTDTQNSVRMAFTAGGSPLEWVKDIAATWIFSLKTMICMPTVYTQGADITPFYLGRLFRIAALLVVAGVLFVALLDRKIGWKEKILMVLMAAVLPIGMNVAHVLAHGVSHTLMYYALWLIQPFGLLLCGWLLEQHGQTLHKGLRRLVQLAPVVVLCAILMDNVQTANLTHVDNQMRVDATEMLYTRVLARMEAVPGYEPGKTPVVILGRGDRQLILPRTFEPVRNMTMQGVPVVSVDTPQFLDPYFEYVLQVPMNLDRQNWEQVQASEAMQQMPSYPDADCVQMVEGRLLVKLGSQE